MLYVKIIRIEVIYEIHIYELKKHKYQKTTIFARGSYKKQK